MQVNIFLTFKMFKLYEKLKLYEACFKNLVLIQKLILKPLFKCELCWTLEFGVWDQSTTKKLPVGS